jgi:hypothetical protein
MAAKKARRDRRRVSRKARGQALVKTTVVKNLGKVCLPFGVKVV